VHEHSLLLGLSLARHPLLGVSCARALNVVRHLRENVVTLARLDVRLMAVDVPIHEARVGVQVVREQRKVPARHRNPTVTRHVRVRHLALGVRGERRLVGGVLVLHVRHRVRLQDERQIEDDERVVGRHETRALQDTRALRHLRADGLL